MAVYSIYKYELSQISALEAMTICDGSKETPLSLAQEVLDGALSPELDGFDWDD